MLRRGLPKLRGLPEITQGVPVARLVTETRALHDQLVTLGSDRFANLNLVALPRIELAFSRT